MKEIRLFLVFTCLLSAGFSLAGCDSARSFVNQQRALYEKHKIESNNQKVWQALQEGGAAFEAKNYDLAITKFDQGYRADPDYPGSAPVMLNNKALSLINRGTQTYNASVKAGPQAENKEALREATKKDFEDAVAATERALELLKIARPANDEVRRNIETNFLLAFSHRKAAYRLLAQTGLDRTKGQPALNAFREYLAAESDPAKKLKAQLELALTLQDSDQFELSSAEFKKLLETDPDNIDALAGLSLNLVKIGYANAEPGIDREHFREALTYLQKYVRLAPDSHKFKEEAKSLIETLMSEIKPKASVKSPPHATRTLSVAPLSRQDLLEQNRATAR